MHNIHELERRWRYYKYKKMRLFFIIIALFILTALLAFLIGKTKPLWLPLLQTTSPKKALIDTNVSKKEHNSTTTNSLPVMPAIVIEINHTKPATQPTKVLSPSPNELTPTFEFLNTLDVTHPNRTANSPTKNTPPPKKVATKPAPPKQSTSQPTNTTRSVDVRANQQTQADIEDLKSRFNRNKNPELGIAIAHYYYKEQNFALAYEYAYQANSIDNSLVQTWLIAAKALYKLNKKPQAIQLLNMYINSTQNDQAKTVLKQMQEGAL